MKTPLLIRGLATEHGPALDTLRPSPAASSERLTALTWFKAAWQDLQALPTLSLGLGVLVATIVWAAESLISRVPQMMMPSVLACIAIAPFVFAMCFSMSRLLRAGGDVRTGLVLEELRRSALALGTLSLMLVLVAIVGLRLTAIAIALSMGPAVPAEVLTELSSGGIVPLPAFFAGSAAVAAVVFALATFGVPAVNSQPDGVVSGIGLGLRLLREHKAATSIWVCVLMSVGALAVWVTPAVLVVGLPLVAYANWHGFNMSRKHSASSQNT